MTRKHLYEAATTLLTRNIGFSTLKAWGLGIMMAMTGISGVGLIRAMRPGGDAPLEAKSALHTSDHAAFALQRKGVLVFHMA